MKFFILVTILVSSLWSLSIGEVPKGITLGDKNGGLVVGGAWESSMLKDKVHVLFYVDPDEKDTNEAFSQALKAANLDKSNYTTVAIINLAATWKPNIIIEALLKSKQKKYPNAIYAKDKNKLLVKEWGLADDSSDIVVFDKDGKVLYIKEGKLSEDEITKVITLIKDKMQ